LKETIVLDLGSTSVLSPENPHIEEADSIHVLEGRINHSSMARYGLLFRGLSPWYGTERKLSEPGRPVLFLQWRIWDSH